LSLAELALLLVASLGAGSLNAVAGGGSFLTFPALMAVGVPPIIANATSAVAVTPGYAGSVLGFKSELSALEPSVLRTSVITAALGGVLGALLLLVTPQHLFVGLIPWLLLVATVLFAVGPRLSRRAGGMGHARWRVPGLLVVCIYGGYFNGGLGILLMALYALVGEANIHTANGLKNLSSLVLALASVAAFALAGAVDWHAALLMMVGTTVGGFLGAHWAKRLPAQWIRALVTTTGVVMTVVFFRKYG
jgi:uncharacterized protein